MATDASGIPREMELEIVGVVTVAAGHTLLIHLALEKGTVDIDLFHDLAVGVIESLFEQRQTMGVQQRAIE
jgi:hypothetical protein